MKKRNKAKHWFIGFIKIQKYTGRHILKRTRPYSFSTKQGVNNNYHGYRYRLVHKTKMAFIEPWTGYISYPRKMRYLCLHF